MTPQTLALLNWDLAVMMASGVMDWTLVMAQVNLTFLTCDFFLTMNNSGNCIHFDAPCENATVCQRGCDEVLLTCGLVRIFLEI
jgi:hypothetical protein